MNGHPKLGSDISVHHMYYENGYFKQTNGSIIGQYEDLPVTISEINKVYDAEMTGTLHGFGILVKIKNNSPVKYTKYPDEKNHEYHYARWLIMNGSVSKL